MARWAAKMSDWKKPGALALGLGFAKTILDWYGRLQASVDMKKTLPALFAARWISPIVVIAGFGLLYASTRNPLIVSGILDHHGNAIEKQRHPVIRYAVGAAIAAVVGVIVFVGAWHLYQRFEPPDPIVQTVRPPKPAGQQLSLLPPHGRQSHGKNGARGKSLPLNQPTPISPTTGPSPVLMPPSSAQPTSTTTQKAPVVTVYSELAQIRFSMSVLDHNWQAKVDDIKKRQVWPYKYDHRPMPMPDQLPDDLVEALAAEDRDASSNMRESFLPQLRKIHDDAIAQLNWTPNRRQEDAEHFQGLTAAAMKPASVKDLEIGRVNRNRFSNLVFYLNELLRQVGEVPEKPVP